MRGKRAGLWRVAGALALTTLVPASASAIGDGPVEELVYGGDRAFPPYEFLDEGGEPAGLNIDLIRAVAHEKGFRVRIELLPWPEVLAGLQSGAIDVAALYRSSRRGREMDFVIPHEFVHHELVIRAGSPPIANIEALAGKRVLVEGLTYSVDALTELGFGDDIIQVESEPEALRQLVDGVGDVAVVTQISGRPFGYRAEFDGKVTPTGPPVFLSEYAFAVKKGRRDLVDRLSDGVLKVKASGEYERIYTRWVRPETGASRVPRIFAGSLAVALILVLASLVWNRTLRRRVVAQTEALRLEYEERARAQAALATTERNLKSAQKMEAVGRLAGGVAHDFNNIITVILGSGGFLREDLVARGEPTEEVDTVIAAAERASRLTRQLLAFSRATPGDVTAIDVCKVVRDTESMLRRLMGEDITMETVVPSMALIVEAGTTQLEQVVLNLAVNARDAMPQGGTLRVEVEPRVAGVDDPWGLDPGDHVVIRVSDTGVGMDEATRARIFEPFFTTKAQGRGTGLGLATVSALMEKLGGRVRVESAPGEGTTFTVILPRSAAPASPPTQDVLSIRSERSAKVLVVEDDEVLRRTTASALTRAGFTVVEATDGEHALTLGADSTIDLVVTDVVMPRHNGPALVAQLRATRPGIPVLYVSGYVQDDDALDLEAPNTAFLGKPYTSAALVNAVESLLESGSA